MNPKMRRLLIVCQAAWGVVFLVLIVLLVVRANPIVEFVLFIVGLALVGLQVVLVLLARRDLRRGTVDSAPDLDRPGDENK